MLCDIEIKVRIVNNGLLITLADFDATIKKIKNDRKFS